MRYKNRKFFELVGNEVSIWIISRTSRKVNKYNFLKFRFQ